MSRHTRSENEQTDGALCRFERNRFFRGKLLTARDMAVEQSYHADRLHTLARFTAGTGVVRGLAIERVQSTAEGVAVTVEPGLAIDGIGRPIVVDVETTRTLPEPGGDELFVQLRHATVDQETVPIPEIEDAPEGDRTHNRAVESFGVTYRESPPTVREPPEVSVQEGEDLRAAIERSRRRRQRESETGTDPAVFLGAFRRAEDGTWGPAETGPQRPLVYDPDLLFGLLSERLDGDTETTRSEPEPAAVERRVQQLQTELEAVRSRQDRLARHATGKTLDDTARAFEQLAEDLADHDGTSSRLARELSGLAADRDPDPVVFRRRVRELADVARRLATALEQVATTDSLDRYREGVSALESTLETDADTLDIANAQDAVVAAARDLEVLRRVVPDQ